MGCLVFAIAFAMAGKGGLPFARAKKVALPLFAPQGQKFTLPSKTLCMGEYFEIGIDIWLLR